MTSLFSSILNSPSLAYNMGQSPSVINTINKRSFYILYALALIFPLFTFFLKVTSDSGYSKNDAAEIAVTAQRIYQGFLSSENNPVSSAYLNRDFRASAYPILISFGLIGTHG
ncbi:MAG: hypothetical protein ACXVAX_12995, partial [Pseudobdellovibrio sp.]